jgi:cyclohexanecarboxylate-CoA ligase
MKGLFLDDQRRAIEKLRGIWPGTLITRYFDRWVKERPDATAIVAFRDADGSSTCLTWRELARRVSALAAGLRARGIDKGDVVSFQLPNGWEFIALHLACVRLGAVTNPLMPIFRRRELAFMLAHAESRLLVVPERFRGFEHGALARELQPSLPALKEVLVIGDSFEELLAHHAANDSFMSGSAMHPDDVVQLLYTSGTTGEPKGAMHTSNTLIGTTLKFIERMRLGASDVVLAPSPLAHQAGFEYGMLLAVLLGVPIVTMDVWNAARAVELIEEHKATYTFAATPFLADLASFPDLAQRRIDSFRLFVTSGAPIPPPVVAAARERLGATVVAGWGMTETGIATTTLLSGHKVLDSDGIALPGEEVRIVDENNAEVPRGVPGELRFRGAALFVGYLKRPELYNVDAEGWFDTGDLARMDEEGYIRVCGRKKDIIIRGGENIPVLEIESALYRLPEVQETAIIAMPDARLGERACAYVVPRPGQTLTLERMREHLAAEGVSKHFWPERLELVEAMPRTPTGKIQKFVLRDTAKGFVNPPEGKDP